MASRLRPLLWLSLFLCATSNERPVEIVLARCRENIDWVEDFGYGNITTVYDKCGTTAGPGHNVERPNVGREGGTFLQHIVDNYDQLADWTVFSQAEKPTYGYRGHRLGGGHMMRNVQFKDYVEAGKTRQDNPLFFVFTTVMFSSDDHIFQCIRHGYGEDYVQPGSEVYKEKMCGAVDDWHRWYEFPQWFTSMVERLQEEQKAPLSRFDVAKAFNLLGVQPAEGVTFFAQGARFAASREAIRARPKAYYAGLLEHMNHQDPWAGYYLEWLWYYVLGGNDAPCGFEEPIVNSHLAWKGGKGRQDLMDVQAVSGVSGVSGTSGSNSVVITLVVISIQIEQQVNLQGGASIAQFSNGDHIITVDQVITTLSIVFNNATLNFQNALTFNNPSGSITGETIILGGTASIIAASITVVQLTVVQTAVINAPLSLSSGTVTLGNTTIDGILTISSTSTIANTAFNGRGRLRCNKAGVGVNFRFVVFVVSIIIELSLSASARRTDLSTLTTNTYCGSSPSTISLGSGTAVIFDLSCTSSTQPQFSNTVGTLNSNGGLVYLTSISSSSKPTLISTWNNVASTPIEIDNVAASGSFCVTVLVYGGASSCTSSWSSVTFDSCQSGYSCTLTGGVYSGDSTKCQAQFCQSGGGGSNNNALLGLIALVAIVPLAGLAAFVVWYFWGRGTEAPPAYNAYQYPQPYQGAPPAYQPPHVTPAYGAETYPVYGAKPYPTYGQGMTPAPTPLGVGSV
eukprot:EG_transcript_2389